MARKKVLVIDDEAQVADMIAEFFSVFGFETRTLTSGKEAMEEVKSYHPDLVTLDLLMPDVSGLEILAMLKEDESTRSVPVLIISAAAESVPLLQDVMEQCGGILNKPPKMKALRERVSTILAPA